MKCAGRIVTKSVSKSCIFWRSIVGDCDYAESKGWFLFGRNDDVSQPVQFILDDS